MGRVVSKIFLLLLSLLASGSSDAEDVTSEALTTDKNSLNYKFYLAPSLINHFIVRTMHDTLNKAFDV